MIRLTIPRDGNVLLWLCLGLSCVVSGCTGASSAEYHEVEHVPLRTPVVRVFWQDRSDKSLKWSDVVEVDGEMALNASQTVTGFPKLDAEKQELVQMDRIDDLLMVGIRDNDDGHLQSGWVAIDTGVRCESHGDHFDFHYPQSPESIRTCLDAEQGNPAHLYIYDGAFVLANDQKNGFTVLRPAELLNPSVESPGQFFLGGGEHITLATVDGRVAYSTWIGGGPNSGRVDVVDLSSPGESSIRYSLTTPTGGLHGATANSGKVFFAPQDGICWVQADVELTGTPETVTVHQLSLGKDEESDRPLRTGAFVNHRNWVLFTTGVGDSSALCLVDAEATSPKVVQLPVNVPDGLRLVTPEVTVTAGGKRLAFLFQDRNAGDVPEQLTIVDLDPNGDRDLSDAEIVKTMKVGASQVEGHYGHHSIGFDSEGRWAVFSNPGDGELCLLSLKDLQVKARFPVGGRPTTVLAYGSQESDH